MSSDSVITNEHAAIGRRTWRATQLSVAFVILALLALLVLPPLLQRRTDAVRTGTGALAESARDFSDDIERDLATEVSAERGFALTGEARYRALFETSVGQHQHSFAQLRPIAARLGSGVPDRLADLERNLAAWEAAPANALSGRLTREQYVTLLPLQERLFQETITAAANLDAEIGRVVTANRAAAHRLQTLGTVLTIALCVLALIAVFLLGRLARRMRTAALQEAALRAEIEKLFESRTRFIRGFTHDLKNPLGAADAYAQLLEDGVIADPGKLEHSLHRIRASIRAAMSLINDVLDLARAEAGELPVKLEPIDVTHVAAQLADEYHAQAEAAQLRLEVSIPAGVPRVVSDEMRVRQVLGNLLSNAIKYTPHGGHIGIRALPSDGAADGHKMWAHIQVWDTGPGIPAAMREKVFDEFTRIDTVQPGAGLGLAISRRIAGALGGKLQLEPGAEGSVFTLSLPAVNGK